MTRKELKRELVSCYDNGDAMLELIDEYIKDSKICDNRCKHYLSDNGNFPIEPCGECSRFHADKFERKEDEN